MDVLEALDEDPEDGDPLLLEGGDGLLLTRPDDDQVRLQGHHALDVDEIPVARRRQSAVADALVHGRVVGEDAALVDVGGNPHQAGVGAEHVEAAEGAFEEADDALGRLVQLDAPPAEVGGGHTFGKDRTGGEKQGEEMREKD